MIISKIRAPRLHQSTARPWPYLCKISGAKYSGVPQKLLALELSKMFSLLSPKSVSFGYPSYPINTFSGFKSR